MKYRLISALLSLLMLLAAIPTIRAFDFEDTASHWAAEYIDDAVRLDLFKGVSETRFDPEGTMTRGMFITVLGRLEGIDLDFWSGAEAPQFFDDVAPTQYYAPYISWAVCNGIADGMSPTSFLPDAPITREQMAKLIAFYVQRMRHELTAPQNADIPESFADAEDISGWARESVDVLRQMGILNGLPDENGGISFVPAKSSTRAECAAVFCRINAALVRNQNPPALPDAISFPAENATVNIGGSLQLTPIIAPEQAKFCALVWRSSDPKIMSVDANGLVKCTSFGTAVISVYTPNGLHADCRITCEEHYASAEETKAEKCLRLFGEVVADPRAYYNNEDGTINYQQAQNDMVDVTLQVWDLNDNGDKYTRYFTIKVHKNIAATVVQIFREIYDGEEKFPIHYIGGFSHGGHSEHTIGTAIDINPNENYYYNSRTGEQVGSYWKPGEDPYSIPLDGEVARIFKKYGFSQGIWNWTVDYMHFSYFGT
ncbi:MAG: S-layer homology domain-containing protein [Oscillospiraceae bacterium]|nr:S-layer homology domain-containing protein [Oscillospiraceae bacterium]